MPKKPTEANLDASVPLEDNQHERFAQKLAFGDCSIAEAYLRAGYDNGAKNASRIAKKYGISERVEWLKKQTEKGNVLSAIEKREFCALAVRTPIGEINEGHVLCQSLKRRRLAGRDDEGGWEVEEIKAVDKLKSIEVDNAMAGHNKPQEHHVTVDALSDEITASRAR